MNRLFRVVVVEAVKQPDGQYTAKQVAIREVRASSVETARDQIRALAKAESWSVRSIGIKQDGDFQVVLQNEALTGAGGPLPGAVWKRGPRPPKR